jgi:hypothetical protein
MSASHGAGTLGNKRPYFVARASSASMSPCWNGKSLNWSRANPVVSGVSGLRAVVPAISMTTITTIGIDLAKKVFQVHGVDAEGKVVFARKLRSKEVLAFFAKLAPCLVGMEACGSGHHWAREIAKLAHSVKLMPPKYVKAYVKRGKTDAGDAAACAAAG